MTAPKEDVSQLAARADAATARLDEVKSSIARSIFGLEEVVEQALCVLLSGGHGLLVGAPGLAKTRLVHTLAIVTGLDDKRVQFTPDLMPADILGSEVLEEDAGGKRSFRFIPGPVFTRLLMADEINRASPRTQAALLQAMQEGFVTVAGVRHDLPRPFHVLATQNPIEQEGTYPLPEAQLDRFMLQINIDYPDAADERRMILATTGTEEEKATAVFNAEEIMAAQRTVRQLPIGQKVVDGILQLVQSGRPEQSKIDNVKKFVSWGPGPRAAQAFMLATRAYALLDGRYSPSLDDVIDIAPAVLRHRMALHFAARAEGKTLEDIIKEMCAGIG